MADRNQLKVADRHGIADDDPFAELTRIMGFDPRQPVRPQSLVHVVSAEPAQDAFDIDLEKELMGELADFDDEAPASDHAYAAPADAAPVQPQWPSTRDEAAAVGIAGQDLGLDAAMDEEVAASLEQDFRVEDEAVAYEPSAEALYGGPAADEAPAMEVDAEPQPEIGEAMDDFIGQALDDDYRFDDPAVQSHADESRDAAEPEGGVYAVADAGGLEAADMAAAPATGATDDDFTTYFDDALADSDDGFADQAVAAEVPAPVIEDDAFELDDAAFAALDEEQIYEDPAGQLVAAEPAEEPVFEAAEEPAVMSYSEGEPAESFDEGEVALPVYEAAADEPEAVAEEDGFDSAFEEAFASGMTEEPAPEPVAATAAPEPAPLWPVTAQPSVPRESTLEDELNALLSRMTQRPVIPDPLQPAANHAAGDRSPATPAEDDDAHGELDAALLADLQALDLGNLSDGPAASAPDVGPAASFHQADASARPAVESNWTWSRGTPLAQPPSMPAQASAPAVSRTEAPAPAMSAPAYAGEESRSAPAFAQPAQTADDMPDVETVDVPERVVALADDLDLPELAFEQDQPEASAYDDLDTEFASLLNDMNGAEPAPAPASAAAYEDDPYGGFSRGQGAGAYGAIAATAAGGMAATDFDVADMPGDQAFAGSDALAAGELDYDPDLHEASTLPDIAENDARPRNRGLLVAAVIGAVAVVGGLGAYALSPGGKGSSDAPAIVKADNQPIKVKPENPGGTVIPNQDNKVYDAVGKSAKPSEPTQQKLVTDVEEPMDVAAKQPESRVVDLSPAADAAAPAADQAAAPMPKSEDRIEPAAAPQAGAAGNQETAVVTPRKVRTMVVKPDGSLVPREDPAPAKVAAAEPADPAPQHVDPSGDQTGAVAPVAQDKPAAAAPMPDSTPAESKAQSRTTPSVAPIAPQRPADQPVDIVGEVKPDQVAAIDQSAGAGSWSMQIASQPTAESAQKTYEDLARRYASVLDGRGVNIVKAEIAGKGTFYRVRVPASSRNDAVALCTSYKAAGGNCFVSK